MSCKTTICVHIFIKLQKFDELLAVWCHHVCLYYICVTLQAFANALSFNCHERVLYFSVRFRNRRITLMTHASFFPCFFISTTAVLALKCYRRMKLNWSSKCQCTFNRVFINSFVMMLWMGKFVLCTKNAMSVLDQMLWYKFEHRCRI